MKNLIYFFAGIILVTLVSATTVSVMTVKPQSPKITIVKNFTQEGSSDNIQKYVLEKVKEGYIVKSIEGANYSSAYSTWIVVLEKY